MRRAQDWATVGAAAARVDGRVQVGLTSMGATPLRARAVEQAARRRRLARGRAARAAEGTAPPSDASREPEYRAHLAQVLVRQALEQL